MSLTERLIAARVAFEHRTGQKATTAVVSLDDARHVRQYYWTRFLDPPVGYLGHVCGMDILEGTALTGDPEVS